MVDINEAAPVTKLFEVHEKTDKKDILGKQIKVLAYAELTSTKDGNKEVYGVIAFNLNKKLLSTSINASMLERIKEAVEKIGLNEARTTKTEKYLADPIECVIESKITKNDNTFYFFATGEEEEVQEKIKAE